jgi:flagellar FliL protein
VVIAIALGAYYMTSAGGDKKDKSKQDSEKEETHSPEKAKSSKAKSPNKDSQFFDLEEFVVNLNPDSGKQEYLKLIITIQVNKNVNIKKIENKLPVIRDNLTTFLTTLKTEDIKGSSGVAMLKEELLKRLNLLLDPLEIENVLIKELLIT